MTDINLENQKGWAKHLEELDKQEQELKLFKRKVRTEYDESIRKYGDLVLKAKKQEEIEIWRKRKIESLTPEDKEYYTRAHGEALLRGVQNGWWAFVENDIPIPFATHLSIKEFHEKATMANVWHIMGLFESVSQAKRSGKNQPLTLGEHRANGPLGMVRVILF